MGLEMTSPPLDLVCVSYLADAGIQHVADYPPANHGAIITEMIDSIAADGPITALTAMLLGLRVGLISNQIGTDPEGQRLLSTLDRAHIQHIIEPVTHGTTPKLTVITDDAGTRTWFAWLDHAYAQLAVADLSMIANARLAYIDCYTAITGSHGPPSAHRSSSTSEATNSSPPSSKPRKTARSGQSRPASTKPTPVTPRRWPPTSSTGSGRRRL